VDAAAPPARMPNAGVPTSHGRESTWLMRVADSAVPAARKPATPPQAALLSTSSGAPLSMSADTDTTGPDEGAADTDGDDDASADGSTAAGVSADATAGGRPTTAATRSRGATLVRAAYRTDRRLPPHPRAAARRQWGRRRRGRRR